MRYVAVVENELTEILLAPALSCVMVGYSRMIADDFLLPVVVTWLRLKTVQFGEPERSLFEPPADYRSRKVSSIFCGNR